MFPYNNPAMASGYAGGMLQNQPPNNENATAVRPEQVESAVGFLSHPKVANSSPAERVAFLEQKGLRVTEIAEALRRVNPNSQEAILVAQAASTGGSASAAVANLTTPTPSTDSSSDPSTSSTNTGNVPYPTQISAVARFPTPSFTFPQYRPPPGMISISPGMYAYLPGTPPPVAPSSTASKVAGALTVVGAIAAVGYAVKQYMFPDYDMNNLSFSNDAKSMNNTIQPQQQNDGMSDSSNSNYNNNNNRSGDCKNQNNSVIHDTDLSQVNRVAAESKEEIFSKGVAEMKSELTSLSDTLKQQSSDFNRALDTIQSTLQALNNSNLNDSNAVTTTNASGFMDISDVKHVPEAFSIITPEQRIENGVMKMKEALQNMQAESDEKAVKQAVSVMQLYIKNLFNNADVERYRKILRTNSLFKTRVASVPGAQDFLMAAGFEINGPHLEWIKPRDDETEISQWKEPLLARGQDILVQFNNTQTQAQTQQVTPSPIVMNTTSTNNNNDNINTSTTPVPVVTHVPVVTPIVIPSVVEQTQTPEEEVVIPVSNKSSVVITEEEENDSPVIAPQLAPRLLKPWEKKKIVETEETDRIVG